jgi:hypothetical protein
MEKFELKQHGKLIFEGTENECYMKLQRSQSQSADWAMKYEGWTVTPKSELIARAFGPVPDERSKVILIELLESERARLVHLAELVKKTSGRFTTNEGRMIAAQIRDVDSALNHLKGN